ncbi:MAG: mannonate dehydratase [Candidatus Latescibacterota bacterium]|nr:mannonate dehydratase [Candidatus Latescibacterota bacterium]
MYAAYQVSDASDENLNFAVQTGVNHIVHASHKPFMVEGKGYWSKESLTAFRERVESHGVEVSVMAPPLHSNPVDGADNPNIMLGNDKRDQDIDNIIKCVQAAGEAGIPCLKYNLTLLGVVSTGRSEGRGNSTYRYFNFEEMKEKSEELTQAGSVSTEQMWERIDYFVQRVIPVAEEYKVKMACHPHDPGMPPSGFRGIDRVLGTVDGIKKFCNLIESPYHGLNFCQGTVSEMLEDPGKEIFNVIRYFLEQKKIFMVHYRNIRGKRLAFEETYIDEGDVDMWETMKVYHELEYDGVFCPDHVAHSDQDSRWGHRQRAFTAGYIKALIKAVQNP